MKQIVILIFIIASLITISSCKKDEDKNWTKAQLIGTWEQISGTDFVECPEGNNAKIVISESDYTEYTTDEDGCVTEFGMSSNYTFDGKEIVLVNAITLKINALNSTTLTVDIIYANVKVATATYEKQ